MVIKFIDMFCGIGGFRLGLEASTKIKDTEKCTSDEKQCTSGTRHLFRCVWANDNDRYACQVYRRHFGEVHEGDIRAVDVGAIPEHDLLCAGFPCQDFSIAGRRAGIEGARGTLFFEICRVLRAKRPSYVFLENVRGLQSSDDGRAFGIVITSLDELGYDCQWQVLNSKDYGVPQNRERVFIVGHLREKPKPKVFPVGEDGEGNSQMAEPGEPVASSITARGAGEYHAGMQLVGVSKGQGDKPLIYDIYNQQLRANQNLAGALKGEGIADTSLGTTLIIHNLQPRCGNPKQGGTGHLMRIDNIAYALDSGATQAIEMGGIRRLTPLECERLQGFPDGWTKYGLTQDGKTVEISDTQRYKANGNAVTVKVIEAIGRQMVMELKV